MTTAAAAATPWEVADPLPPDDYARIRRRAIFECCKWDPQVEDVPTLADFPLVLRWEVWGELAALAEALARETLAAEAELAERPELHHRLGLPRPVTAALARAAGGPRTVGAARLIRFDFHHTTGGWRISEANSDVPGGLNEASGWAGLVAPYYPDARGVGDAAEAYARAALDGVPAGARVALAHATAYTDDRQVMTYLSRCLDACGARTALVSPAHLRWRAGRASLATDWSTAPVDVVVRFFPGEWLPNLPAACGWSHFFGGGLTPVSNPATALLTQSKRFPLTWDALRTALPTWRALLPDTRDPRDAAWRTGEEWVVKPALGRIGEDVGVPGVTPAGEWTQLARDVSRHPRDWVAQRRFDPTPLDAARGSVYPCIGVYTVGARAVGAYGRLARRPLIDWTAQDVAVLAADGGGARSEAR